MTSAWSKILLSRNFIIALIASLVLVAYAPMSSIASAQTAAEAQKLQQLKQKANKEIDRRINELQSSLAKLNTGVQLDNIGLSASLNATSGQNASVVVAPETKQKAKELVTKYIGELKEIKQKITDTDNVTDMQTLAKTIDSQSKLNQSVSVQARVTKAVESMTSVFDKLKSTTKKLQGQVTDLQNCTKDDTEKYCSAMEQQNNKAAVTSAQSSLDNVKTILSTVGSMLSSVVAILLSLVSMIVGMTSSLGSMSSMGDVSGNSSLGGLSSILSSFTALASQLDLTGGLSGSASGLLGGVSGVTSLFSF